MIATQANVIRRLVRQFAGVNWALSDQALMSGLNFVAGVLLARQLPLDVFGTYILAWTGIILAQLLVLALVGLPMMSIAPQVPEPDREDYLRSCMVQALGVSLIASLLLMAGVAGTQHVRPDWNLAPAAVMTGIAALFCQWQEFRRRYCFAAGRPERAFVLDLVRVVVHIGALVALAVSDRLSTNTALGAMALGALVAVFLTSRREWPALLRRGQNHRQWWDRNWFSGRWLLLSNVGNWLNTHINVLMVGALLSAADAGSLRAVAIIMGVLHVYLFGIANVVPVEGARRYASGGLAALRKYVGWTLAGSVSLVLLFCVPLALFPAFWLRLIYGESFVELAELLRFFAYAYMVLALDPPIRAGLRALERTGVIAAATIIGVVMAIVSSYLLIRDLGLIGAGYSTLIVTVVVRAICAMGLVRAFREVGGESG